MNFGLLHKRLKEQRFKMGGPQVSGIPLFMLVSFYFHYNNYCSFIRNIWLKESNNFEFVNITCPMFFLKK